LNQILGILNIAAQHGYNGTVLADQLDYLSAQDSSYFRRLDSLKCACERLGIELIPAVFNVGYAGHILGHNRNLAEGFPVQGAPFIVQGNQAVLMHQCGFSMEALSCSPGIPWMVSNCRKDQVL